MSYRTKRPGVLETEIEKAREEGQWKKVIELAQQLKERPDQSRQHETLGWFLVGEGKLEDPTKNKCKTPKKIKHRQPVVKREIISNKVTSKHFD